MYLGELKQSTAATIPLGQFVLSSDGYSAATGLSLVQADIMLKKAGAAMAQKNSATSPSHDSLGVYNCAVDATDTGTLGRTDVYVNKATAIPVHHHFDVITADEWDRKYAITGPVMEAGIKARGTTQSCTATSAVLASGEAFSNNILIGSTISLEVSSGNWQERSILTCTLATDTVTFDTMDPAPTGAVRYKVFAGAPASATSFPTVLLSVGTGTGQVNASGGKVPATIAAGDLATDSITAASIATAAATKIRDSILNWELFSGFSLAKGFRVFGIVLFGTKTGGNTTTEVYTAPAGGTTVTATVDADSNRSAVATTTSGTP